MKRANDEELDARKVRIISRFDEMVQEARDAFRREDWDLLRSVGETLLAFDPNHMDVKFWIGYCCAILEEFEKATSFVNDLLKDTSNGAACRGNAIGSIMHLMKEEYKEAYAKGLLVKESGLFSEKMFPHESQPWWLDFVLSRSADFAFRDNAKTHHMDFIRSVSPIICAKFDLYLYDDFVDSFKHCYEDLQAKIQSIIDNVPISLMAIHEDAFQNWNVLTKVHQKWVEVKYPLVKQMLESHAQLSLAYLLEIPTIFTNQTLKIVHEFLFIGF